MGGHHRVRVTLAADRTLFVTFPGTGRQQANFVAHVKDYVCDTKHFEEQPEEGFVTLTLAVLDPATGAAGVVNAGAEPPLLLRNAGGGVETLEASSGLPLGVGRGEIYEAFALRLAPGDTLALATDGITEARRGREFGHGRAVPEFLGFEGLVRLAREAQQAQQEQPTTSIREMADRIVEGARAFGRGGFTDDVCLLLARKR